MKGQTLRPARVFPPGRTLKNELDARGWTQRQFAELIGRPVQYVSEIINGKRQLTLGAAKELEAALGPKAEFWLGLEINYRLWLDEAQTGKHASDRLAEIRKRVAELKEPAGKRREPAGRSYLQ